jgi:hypothetical protein
MKASSYRIATGAALILVAVAAVGNGRRTPGPVPESAPATEFSAGRALQHVRVIAQRPHPVGSDDHRRVREYVVDQLQRLGADVHVQDTIAIGTVYAVAGRVRNVVARVRGTQAGAPAVLLATHYDGVTAGPAAGDAGSGVATVLETIRALRAGPPLRNDVIALITDAEEAGLLGAAGFAQHHPWAKDVGVILNFEARGVHGPSFMFQTGEGNLDVARALRGIRHVSATSLSTTVYRRLPNDTDLSELFVLRKPAMNFAFIGGVERYHTPQDDTTHLSPGSVQHHGESALGLARKFGSEPLPRTTTPDAVFFDLPLVGLVAYAENKAVPLATLAVLLLAVGALRLRRDEPRFNRQMLIGSAIAFLSIVVAAAAAFGIAIALGRLHAAMPLGGTARWSDVYAAGVALVVVAIVLATYALLRRWVSAAGAEAGVLLLWALLSLVVSFAVPGASFLFTWPLIAGAVALGVAAWLPDRPILALAVRWLTTVVIVYLVLRLTYIMVVYALGLDATGAPLLAVLTALTTWLLAAHLETLRGNRPLIAPIVAAVAGIALLVIGATTVRASDAHPAAASFAYMVDQDSSKAWLTGSATSESARLWLRQSLAQGASPVSSESSPRWLTRGVTPQRTVVAPLDPRITAPDVAVSDSIAGDTRHVKLRIRPTPGMHAIYLAPDGNVGAIAVAGIAIDTTRYRQRRRWPLELIAPPAEGITVTLVLRAGTHPVVGVMGRIDGIRAVPGLSLPQRPHTILPIGDGDATYVYRRIQL